MSIQTDAGRRKFLCDLYGGAGPVSRHALICQPPSRPLYGDGNEDYSISSRPITDFVDRFVQVHHQAVKYHRQVGDDGLPVLRLETGTHIFAAAFGSPVKVFPNTNPCALPWIGSVDDLDRVPDVDVFSSPILMRVFELARILRKQLGNEVTLGPCDLQSGFDTACLVFDKAEMFMAMHGGDEERAAVKRLTGKCARTLKQFLTEFRREFGEVSPCHCPGTWVPSQLGPWLSNDECGAMSTATFEEFCLPELVDLAETFGGLGMHCCADAEHQFASFKKIPGFYGFNRVAARRGYEPILGPFGGEGTPVHTLAWVDVETIKRLSAKAPAGTRFAFVLMGEPPERARRWYHTMRGELANATAP
jgi:hypothetical protein